jgi:hypothetical protein
MADCKLVYDYAENLSNGNTHYYRVVNGRYYSSGMLLKNEGKLEVYPNISCSDRLIDVLEKCIANKTRVRIWYGGDDGRSWLDEYDMVGRIGYSCGNIKIPILVATSRSYGGGAILTGRIIRIDDVATHKTLFQQENFYVPLMDLRGSEVAGYAEGVYVKEKDGHFVNYANFKKEGAGLRWIQFMRGERYTTGGRV